MRIYLKPQKKKIIKSVIAQNAKNNDPFIIKNGVKYILCSVDKENELYWNDIKNKKRKLK
jgi:hypothetical protein